MLHECFCQGEKEEGIQNPVFEFLHLFKEIIIKCFDLEVYGLISCWLLPVFSNKPLENRNGLMFMFLYV